MTPKRPLLPKEDRDRLRALTTKARGHADESPNRAYAQGVVDTLRWLTGDDMSRLLEEVTR